MIQTQLLKADPPYQIICAAGQVGIQVATLIVTEEKSTEDGGYQIDTHSHPVVNYGLKTLAQEFTHVSALFLSDSFSPLMPEGAVWNKVEISDVRAIGLAGETNGIDLREFIWLVPSIDSIVYAPVWDKRSVECVQEMLFGFRRVGIKCRELPKDSFKKNKKGETIVRLSTLGHESPLVLVEMPSNSYNYCIAFRLFDDADCKSIEQCASNIAEAITFLFIDFAPDYDFSIAFKIDSKKDPYYDYLQQIVDIASLPLLPTAQPRR